MAEAALLMVVATVLRASAAASQARSCHVAVHLLGWLALTTAAWLVVSALGAWSPWWPMAVLGVLGAVADRLWNRSYVRVAGDALASCVTGIVSLPVVAPLPLVGAALAVAAAGYGLDRGVRRLSKASRNVLCAWPWVACLVVLVARYQNVADLVHVCGSNLLHVGVTMSRGGEPITLKTGATAILERPRGGGRFAGAVFFHGAHADGVRQASSVVVRRALLQAGYTVLSVDHPGFGKSPAPDAAGEWTSWDPLPTALAAVETLRREPGVSGVIAFGHSLGAADVARLMVARESLQGAVMSGPGPDDPGVREDYWYDYFHCSRRLNDRVPRETWREVHQRFYLPQLLLERIEQPLYPTLLIDLGREGSSVQPRRQRVYDALPDPKSRVALMRATHDFSAAGEGGLVMGATTVTRALSAHLRRFGETCFQGDDGG